MTCEEGAQIQIEVIGLGYQPGQVVGIIGLNTMTAIKTYQSEHNLPADGQATETLLELLKSAN